MPPYLRLIPSLAFFSACVYVVWQWAQWFGSEEKSLLPRWRARTAFAGLCFATLSLALAVFLFVHATYTGGYPFYHPVELFCIRFGSVAALLGLVASVFGKGRIRPHVAGISALNLLVWFADAVAQ